MAKKAKAKKAVRRTAKASAPSVTPTYLEEGQTYKMGLHNVVRALKTIEKHGHMAKFVKAAKAAGVGGTFDHKTVNFVKDFMVKHKMHADPVGKHIVNAKQVGMAMAVARGRFNCNFN
jgi:ribosomal protein L28